MQVFEDFLRIVHAKKRKVQEFDHFCLKLKLNDRQNTKRVNHTLRHPQSQYEFNVENF